MLKVPGDTDLVDGVPHQNHPGIKLGTRQCQLTQLESGSDMMGLCNNIVILRLLPQSMIKFYRSRFMIQSNIFDTFIHLCHCCKFMVKIIVRLLLAWIVHVTFHKTYSPKKCVWLIDNFLNNKTIILLINLAEWLYVYTYYCSPLGIQPHRLKKKPGAVQSVLAG